MSLKRQNTSSAEPESPPTKKRQSYDYDESEYLSDRYEQPQVNASTGLTNAFPGLGENRNLFYGPAQDGLDYLRMVRSEAQGIPQLLTAPQVQYEEPGQDQEGFFDEDEAVIATPIFEEQKIPYSRAQLAYYESIMLRFDRVRSKMKITPSLDVIQSLPPTMPISLPPSSKIARNQWEKQLVEYSPDLVQVSCIDLESVLELLKLITSKMRKLVQACNEEDFRIQRFGAWLWALLARCPDRGELGSEEISDLRACAKAADTTWHWLQGRMSVYHTDEDISSDDDKSNDVGEQMQVLEDGEETDIPERDLQQHRSEPREKEVMTPSISARQKQNIILDMVITVIGETYGQRDLLDLRRPWKVNQG